MFGMAAQIKIGEWDKPSMELPPGWKDAVDQLARDINYGKKGVMKFVWAVAVDALLNLKHDEVLRRVNELRQLHATDFAGLVARHAADEALVAQLAAEERGQSVGLPRRRKRQGSG